MKTLKDLRKDNITKEGLETILRKNKLQDHVSIDWINDKLVNFIISQDTAADKEELEKKKEEIAKDIKNDKKEKDTNESLMLLPIDEKTAKLKGDVKIIIKDLYKTIADDVASKLSTRRCNVIYKDKVDKIGTETLDTTAQTITEAINELNSKEHIERANKTVTGNALTIGKEHYQQFTVNADTVATLPTDLAYRRIVLYVNCTTKDSILTLKYTKDANTDEIKFKLKQDSLNIFTLDCNETSFVVTKESSEDAVLTSTEEQNGIQI